jgi:hypothetical protein
MPKVFRKSVTITPRPSEGAIEKGGFARLRKKVLGLFTDQARLTQQQYEEMLSGLRSVSQVNGVHQERITSLHQLLSEPDLSHSERLRYMRELAELLRLVGKTRDAEIACQAIEALEDIYSEV